MLNTYDFPEFLYVQSEEKKSGQTVRHPVVIVMGGPVGLTAALDLAAQGIKVVLLDYNSTVSVGSQAVCYARLSGRDILAAFCKKGGLRGGGHSLVEQLVYPRSHVRLASRTLWHSVGSRLATADDPVFDPFVKFGQNGMAKCGVVDVGV